jgi:hypothetical protein
MAATLTKLMALFACNLAASLLAAESREAVPVDGPAYRASLVAIGDGTFTMETSGQKKVVPAGELVTWGALPTMPAGTVVLLADGGQLACTLRGADEETVQLDSPIFGKLALPISQVKLIVLWAPAACEPRDRLLAQAEHEGGESDRLLLENGDKLAGMIHSITHQTIELESEVGTARIELAKVDAILFNPALREQTPPPLRGTVVGFQDGSWFTARAIQTTGVGSNGLTTVRLTSSGGWTAEAAQEDVVLLQPLGGRIEYLSDLPARSYKHVPFLDRSWPYRRDRSATAGLLRWDDRVYPKGVGMHSASRLTYALESDHKRFQAEIALDATAGSRGSVVFRVFVDNQQRFASPVVRGGDRPLPISVNVTGGKRLSLIVDFAEHGDLLDRANWLNARLVK